MICVNCSKDIPSNSAVCPECGAVVTSNIATSTTTQNTATKSRLVAGLLALFLGPYGIHNFYLGYTKKGTKQLVLTLVGYLLCLIGIGLIFIAATSIWSIVDAVKIFTGNIAVDGEGNPLKD